jgi:hypothetical protein
VTVRRFNFGYPERRWLTERQREKLFWDRVEIAGWVLIVILFGVACYWAPRLIPGGL